MLDPFPELAEGAENCPRGCTHAGPPADPECAWDDLAARNGEDSVIGRRVQAVRHLLEALRINETTYD